MRLSVGEEERELRVRESREGREIERQGTGIGEGFEGCGDPTCPTQSKLLNFRPLVPFKGIFVFSCPRN